MLLIKIKGQLKGRFVLIFSLGVYFRLKSGGIFQPPEIVYLDDIIIS
jgi:hypothetical protein